MGLWGFSRARGSLTAAAAALAGVISTFNGAAAAPQYSGSGACIALNGSSTGVTQITWSPGVTTFVATGFLPGDRVTITVSSLSTPGSVRAFGSANDALPPLTTISFGTFTSASGSYTVATAGDLYLQANQQLSATYSFACEGSAPTGPTNSQILEQTRQIFSKVGAQASSQAMGDATSGAISDAFSGGGTTQFSNGQFSTSFAALENAQTTDGKSSDGVKDMNGAFAALGYAKAPYKKAPPRVRSPWHAWIDGRFTGFEDKSAASFDGWHSNVTGGASYRFTDNFLAGILVGYENSKYSMTSFGTPTSLRGEGVSGGGYFGWKFFDRMRLDGMLTYGRINYGAAAGVVTGDFGADRITGMSKLSGRYGFGTFWLEPSAMLTIASESQDSFTDTAAVFHDKFNFVVGRASTGGTIGTPLVWGSTVVTPTFGVFGDYRFGDQTAAALSTVPTFNNGWSAHINGGVSVAMPGGVTASATGEYGGLGDTLQYWRAKGSLGVKF